MPRQIQQLINQGHNAVDKDFTVLMKVASLSPRRSDRWNNVGKLLWDFCKKAEGCLFCNEECNFVWLNNERITFHHNRTLSSGGGPSNKVENKLCTLVGYMPKRLVNQTRLTASVRWFLFPHVGSSSWLPILHTETVWWMTCPLSRI